MKKRTATTKTLDQIADDLERADKARNYEGIDDPDDVIVPLLDALPETVLALRTHAKRAREADRFQEKTAKRPDGRAEIKRLVEAQTFSNIGAPGAEEQVMLHVYWSQWKRGDLTTSHSTQIGRVTADLGLDTIPVPGFTDAEMQRIMFAAKREALRCLRARPKRKPG